MIFEHSSKNKKILLIIFVALLIIGGFLFFYENNTENVERNWNTIASELQECLPKSDTASHERCQELISLIQNYEDCVVAGFSIMKSNPPQCATLDGRTFAEKN